MLNSVNVTFELYVYIKELLAHKQSTSLVRAYQILHTQERKNSGLHIKFWCYGSFVNKHLSEIIYHVVFSASINLVHVFFL